MDLAKARILQSRRKNFLPLQELCLNIISKHMEHYVTNEKAFIEGKIHDTEKNLILQHLANGFDDKSRNDPPETSPIQDEFVALLINSKMKSIDFAVLGAMKFNGDRGVWEGLVSKAPPLTAIYDGRVNKSPVDRLTFRCLEYVVKFKELRELEMQSYFCNDGDIEVIAKNLNQLEKLHLILLGVTRSGIESAARLERLESFEFMCPEGCTANNEIVSFCLQLMPQLKVVGRRADDPEEYSYHNISSDLKQVMKLEHLTFGDVIADINNLSTILPNVKYVCIPGGSAGSPGGPRVPPAVLQGFPELISVHVSFHSYRDDTLPMIKLVGSKLTNLILCLVAPHNYDMSQIFHYCPNLTFLYISLTAFEAEQCRQIKSENLKLKKLHIIEVDIPKNILPSILAAPLLEDVKLNDILIPTEDCKRIAAMASACKGFQCLKKLSIETSGELLYYATTPPRAYAVILENMMKKIMANSPCLEMVDFDFPSIADSDGDESSDEDEMREDEEFASTLGPFLDVVNGQ